MGKRKITIEMEDHIIERYKSGESTISIGKDYDVTSEPIRQCLIRNGVDRRDSKDARRRYFLNEDIFNELDDETYYWIGFITSDGSIYKQDGHQAVLGINIHERDKKHLFKFTEFMGTNKPPLERKRTSATSWEIKICSDKIVDRLKDLGVRMNKKFNGCCLTKELKTSRHFWRGIIDGDGGIRRRPNRNNILTLTLSGHLSIIKPFRDFTDSFVNKQNSIGDRGTYYSISYCGNKAAKIVRVLYSNCNAYLDRKYQFVEDLL